MCSHTCEKERFNFLKSQGVRPFVVYRSISGGVKQIVNKAAWGTVNLTASLYCQGNVREGTAFTTRCWALTKLYVTLTAYINTHDCLSYLTIPPAEILHFLLSLLLVLSVTASLRSGHTERGLPQRTAVSVRCGMLHSKQTLLTIIFWKHSS